jgi:hypothetical protein
MPSKQLLSTAGFLLAVVMNTWPGPGLPEVGTNPPAEGHDCVIPRQTAE